MNDPYETLGVSRSAPASVIRAAYKARIRETHPDAGGDAAAAKAVNDAYDLLMDPSRLEAWLGAQHTDAADEQRSPSGASSSRPRHPSGSSEPPRPAPDTRTRDERLHAWTRPLDMIRATHFRSPRSWRWNPWIWISAFVYIGYTFALHGMLIFWLALPALALALYSPLLAVLPGIGASFLLMPFPHALGLLEEFRWLVPLFGQPALYAVLLGTIFLSMRAADVKFDRYLVEQFLRTEAVYKLKRYIAVSVDEPTNGLVVRLADSSESEHLTVQWNGYVSPGAITLVHDGKLVDALRPAMLLRHSPRITAILEAEAASAT